jgi:hypothetical protein
LIKTILLHATIYHGYEKTPVHQGLGKAWMLTGERAKRRRVPLPYDTFPSRTPTTKMGCWFQHLFWQFFDIPIFDIFSDTSLTFFWTLWFSTFFWTLFRHSFQHFGVWHFFWHFLRQVFKNSDFDVFFDIQFRHYLDILFGTLFFDTIFESLMLEKKHLICNYLHFDNKGSIIVSE